MANQQERETAVVNDHMYHCALLYHFHVSITPLGSKIYRDGDTYDHSLQLH